MPGGSAVQLTAEELDNNFRFRRQQEQHLQEMEERRGRRTVPGEQKEVP